MARQEIWKKETEIFGPQSTHNRREVRNRYFKWLHQESLKGKKPHGNLQLSPFSFSVPDLGPDLPAKRHFYHRALMASNPDVQRQLLGGLFGLWSQLPESVVQEQLRDQLELILNICSLSPLIQPCLIEPDNQAQEILEEFGIHFLPALVISPSSFPVTAEIKACGLPDDQEDIVITAENEHGTGCCFFSLGRLSEGPFYLNPLYTRPVIIDKRPQEDSSGLLHQRYLILCFPHASSPLFTPFPGILNAQTNV